MSKFDVLHQVLSQKMDGIADALSPEYKLTLIARHPTNPNANIVIGDDTYESAADLLLHPERMPVIIK